MQWIRFLEKHQEKWIMKHKALKFIENEKVPHIS